MSIRILLCLLMGFSLGLGLGAVYNSFYMQSLTRMVYCPHPAPPPRGREQFGGCPQSKARNGAGLKCKQHLGAVYNLGLPPPQGEARSGRVPCVGCVAA